MNIIIKPKRLITSVFLLLAILSSCKNIYDVDTKFTTQNNDTASNVLHIMIATAADTTASNVAGESAISGSVMDNAGPSYSYLPDIIPQIARYRLKVVSYIDGFTLGEQTLLLSEMTGGFDLQLSAPVRSGDILTVEGLSADNVTIAGGTGLLSAGASSAYVYVSGLTEGTGSAALKIIFPDHPHGAIIEKLKICFYNNLNAYRGGTAGSEQTLPRSSFGTIDADTKSAIIEADVLPSGTVILEVRFISDAGATAKILAQSIIIRDNVKTDKWQDPATGALESAYILTEADFASNNAAPGSIVITTQLPASDAVNVGGAVDGSTHFYTAFSEEGDFHLGFTPQAGQSYSTAYAVNGIRAEIPGPYTAKNIDIASDAPGQVYSITVTITAADQQTKTIYCINYVTAESVVFAAGASQTPAGSDSTGDGSIIRPFATVSRALLGRSGTGLATDSVVMVSGEIFEGACIEVPAISVSIYGYGTGSGAASGTIKAQGAYRTFSVGSGAALVLGGRIRVTGAGDGSLSGGVLVSGGALTLAGAEISGCKAGSGGGIEVSDGKLAIHSGSVGAAAAGNTATDGGGVYIKSAEFTMTGGSIVNNAATAQGGGLYIGEGITFTDGNIMTGGSIGESGLGNTAATGGGIYYVSSAATMTGGMIRGNSVSGSGGGIYIAAGSFTLTDASGAGASAVRSNTAVDGGGVYVAASGKFAMTDDAPLISENSAVRGGGLYIENSLSVTEADASTLSGGEISGNSASGAAGQGGGIYLVAGDLILDNTDFSLSGNTASSGGGLYIKSGARLLLQNDAEISGNSVSGSGSKGGGLYLEDLSGLPAPSTGTISGNRADSGQGGGIYIAANSGSLAYNGAGLSITGNSAAQGGGICFAPGTWAVEGGTIGGLLTAANTASYGGGIYLAGGNLSISGSTEIIGNSATYGGGLYIAAGASGIMSGGVLKGNRAYYGGGLFLAGSAAWNMSGGTIGGASSTDSDDANTATLGGAIYAELTSAVAGAISLSGDAFITPDMSSGTAVTNDVYLPNTATSASKRLITASNLSNSPAVMVSLQRYEKGVPVLSELVNSRDKFIITDYLWEIGADGKLYGSEALKDTSITANFAVSGDGDDPLPRPSGTITGLSSKNTPYRSIHRLLDVIRAYYACDWSGGEAFSDDTLTITLSNGSSGEEITPYTDSGPESSNGMADISGTSSDASRLYPQHIIFVPGTANATINAQNGHRLVNIGSGYDVTLRGGTNGIILKNGASGTQNGGGVYAVSGSKLAVNNVKIQDCRASNGSGGAIYAAAAAFLVAGAPGEAALDGLEISGCYAASYGGGLYLAASGADGSPVELSELTITGCQSTGSGGGIYMAGGVYKLTSSEISTCTASSSGGGVYIASGTFTLNGDGGSAVIKNCTAGSYGGGLCIAGGTFVTSGSADISIENCTAARGGGLYLPSSGSEGSPIELSHLKITGGQSTVYGGGIYMAGGFYKLTSSEISSCTATTSGGGVYIAGGTFTLSGSGVIQNCTATTSGGGVYIAGGTFALSDSGVIQNCTASTSGGGAYITSAGTLKISGAAHITPGTDDVCDVYIVTQTPAQHNAESTKRQGTIWVDGALTESLVATITPSAYPASNPIYVLSGSGADDIKNAVIRDAPQFNLKQPAAGSWKIDELGRLTRPADIACIIGTGTLQFDSSNDLVIRQNAASPFNFKIKAQSNEVFMPGSGPIWRWRLDGGTAQSGTVTYHDAVDGEITIPASGIIPASNIDYAEYTLTRTTLSIGVHWISVELTVNGIIYSGSFRVTVTL